MTGAVVINMATSRPAAEVPDGVEVGAKVRGVGAESMEECV